MFKIFKLILVILVFQASTAFAVNVAVIAPKNENMTKFGQDLVEGVRIAVDIANQKGGVLGEKINLIEVEDKCEDLSAVSTAQMLSFASSPQEKLSLVIGPYCQNKFDEISEIYAMGKIIRVTPMPLSSAQAKHEWKGLFKIGGEVRSQAQKFTEVYQKKFAGKNLAFVYDSRLEATAETAFRVQELFIRDGLSHQITLYDAYQYQGDYVKLAKEILLNNQAAYLLGETKTIARLAQSLQERNSEVVLFTDEYFATAYFFKEMASFVEGVYFLTPENLKDKPFFTEELVKLRLAGKEPRGLGIYGYAAVKLWIDMVETSQSFDFSKVTAQVEKSSFKLPWGEVRFSLGNASRFADYAMYQIVNGEYTQVH